MANTQHSAAPALLAPRYVANLATFAESDGLTTRFYVDVSEKKADVPIEYLLAAEWHGTKTQVLAMNVLRAGDDVAVPASPRPS